MRNAHALFFASVLGIGLLAATGCTKDDQQTNSIKSSFNVSGNATGAQETPAVTTPGTGTITGTYDSTTNKLTYTITWQSISAAPTAMHFHGAALAGVAAGVQIGITGFTAAPTGNVSGTANLTQAQEADLVAGKWYYNIHTPSNPNGEIRGQIMLQ